MSSGIPDRSPDRSIELTAPPSALSPGDRMPNFVLADQEGLFRAFYERVRGNPTALLVLAENAVDREFEGLATALAANGAALDLLAIAPDDPDRLKALAGQTPLARLLLADTKRTIINGLVNASGLKPDPGLWLLLDANQRLLEVRAGADLADWAMKRLAKLASPAPSQYLD
jgi:hypothetical protein